jgi:hypothetical protein
MTSVAGQWPASAPACRLALDLGRHWLSAARDGKDVPWRRGEGGALERISHPPVRLTSWGAGVGGGGRAVATPRVSSGDCLKRLTIAGAGYVLWYPSGGGTFLSGPGPHRRSSSAGRRQITSGDSRPAAKSRRSPPSSRASRTMLRCGRAGAPSPEGRLLPQRALSRLASAGMGSGPVSVELSRSGRLPQLHRAGVPASP